MDAETFTDLALRNLAGETSEAERRALEAELAASPDRREEYDGLRIAHDVLRLTAPLAEAEKAATPELPAWRVNELRTAVHQHFGPARKPGRSFAQNLIRWLLAGGGLTAAATAVLVFSLSNRIIEVGTYQTSLVRGDDPSNVALDLPAAKIVSFEQDSAFDQWQNRPLAWNERAKIWVDNEHDLLHIVRREQGRIESLNVPLAPTPEGQRDQIRHAVEDARK